MMERVNCVIVDDEPIARAIIQSYCSHLPILQVVSSCSNALEAKTILQKQKADIIFLDINMPVLDGIAFLKTIKNPPQVILTTAFKEYALEAFDLAVCDYLLKPFSLERFIVAVDKAMEKLKLLNRTSDNRTETETYTFIKADGKIYNISIEDMLYAEASGNYTKIVMENGTIMPAMTFTSVEELLPRTAFVRVHRSFIINKSKITHVEGNRVYINKHEIPIGSSYKNDFLEGLGMKDK